MKKKKHHKKNKTVFRKNMNFTLSVNGNKDSDSLHVEVESKDMEIFHLTFSDYAKKYFDHTKDEKTSGKIEYYCRHFGKTGR